MTLILAKIISVSIPHAGSSNTTPFSRRTTHNLVSWFSRAATFPAHRPPSRGCRVPSPHLLRFVWCYKKEGLFEADSITLSFSIQTCSEGTPFSVTPHGRVGWNDGTENLSRRGSRHPRCMKLARREREALENVLFIPAWCHHVITMGKITGLDRLSPLFS